MVTFKPVVGPGSQAITLKATAGDTVETATAAATAAAAWPSRPPSQPRVAVRGD